TVRYAHGPQVGKTIKWPGSGGGSQASIELLPQVGSSRLSASGPWALNRLLDQASLSPGRSREVSIATFNISGRKVVLEITAHSAKSTLGMAERPGVWCPGRG